MFSVQLCGHHHDGRIMMAVLVACFDVRQSNPHVVVSLSFSVPGELESGRPGFDSRLCCGSLSGSCHTCDFKLGTPVRSYALSGA